MAQRVRRIGVLSMAKFSGALCFALGIILAVIFMAFSSTLATMGMGRGVGSGMGTAGALFVPVIYGVAGFLGGALQAWLYNIIAGFTGGVEIELE